MFSGFSATAQRLRRLRILGPGLGGVLLVVAGSSVVLSQGGPWFDRAPQREQVCARLEGQLSALDRSGAAEGRGEQVRRYEEGVTRQEAELERLVTQTRRLGCERTGFFLFGSGQPPQCDQLRSQIERLRSNLDQMMSTLEQMRGSGGDRGEQRQQILVALAQNACGPQYQNAAPQRPRGIFDTLFGNAAPGAPGVPSAVPMPGEASSSSAFRTVCVRKCDGSFFPISFSTSPSRFADDERSCRRACPATEVELYTYRNPGEEIAQATSVSGRPYTELPNAFRYRQEYNAACTCKRPGESWAAAVREDPTVERGDIVVTDEKAKAMMKPKPAPAAPSAAKPQRTDTPVRRNAAAPRARPAAEPAGAPSPLPSAGASAPRNIGPQFTQPR